VSVLVAASWAWYGRAENSSTMLMRLELDGASSIKSALRRGVGWILFLDPQLGRSVYWSG
jgi:hypothetical protein